MATIGVSKPYYALYQSEGGTVSYQGGGLMGKAVELSASIEAGEENNLYADNMVVESDSSFAGGTLTITTDDLLQEASKVLLGLKTNEVTVGEEKVTELVYDDESVAPYLGVGIIIKKKRSGSYAYRAIIFTKVQFKVPEASATTQGEAVEWQTPAIEGSIFRDDSATHVWKREATLDSEEKAEAYIKQVLHIGAPSPEPQV